MFMGTRRCRTPSGVGFFLTNLLGHTDQVSQGIGGHLAHDPGPVDLDGLLRGPQLDRNLPVPVPRDHQMEDLLLPGGQELQVGKNIPVCFPFFPGRSVMVKGLVYCVQ